MEKKELARELARKTGVTRAEAADQVDRMVNDILQKIRNGESASVPGLGQFRRDPQGNLEFFKEQTVEKG